MPSEALLNANTVRTHVCAQCFGPLIEKFIDGHFVVMCPKQCQPGGFVSRESAERRRSESLAELYDVYHNLPALRPETSSKDDAKVLFGDDDF